MPKPAHPEHRGAKSKWVEIEKMVQLGFMFPAAIFIGGLVGTLLDRLFHTAWIYLAGLGFGIVAGFVKLFRTALAPEKTKAEDSSRKSD